MPMPTTSRRKRDQGAAQPAASLPTMAMAVSTAATSKVPWDDIEVGSSRRRFTDAPTLTKKIGVKTAATGRISCSMVSNWLVPERMIPAAKAPTMRADPARAASAESPRAKATAKTRST